MDFRLPPTGHFMNVNLEKCEVKLSAAKFAQSFARHDPSGAARALSSVYLTTSAHPRIAITNRSDAAASIEVGI